MQPRSRALIAAGVAVWGVTFLGFAGREARIMGAAIQPEGILVLVDTCNADHRVEVAENPETVIVWVFARNDTNDDCADGFILELEDPLAGRTLIDASTGAAIDVTPLPAE
jgi:hypothetical protein